MDYNSGKIYSLVYLPTSEILHVGHTTLSLRAKWNELKQTSVHDPLYTFIRDVGWKNIVIELVENFPCASVEDITVRETYYMNLFNPTFKR